MTAFSSLKTESMRMHQTEEDSHVKVGHGVK